MNKIMYDDFKDEDGTILLSSLSKTDMKIQFPNLKETDIEDYQNFVDFVNMEMGKTWKNLHDEGAIFPPELFTKYRSKLEGRLNLKLRRIDQSINRQIPYD